MGPSKSREHRMRVLQNQERILAELAQTRQQHGGGQAQMPLIVEVKGRHQPKQPSHRARRTRGRHAQSVLDDI